MNDLPLQLILFGIVDLFIEPFTYGCAAFLLSYRFSQAFIVKIIIISSGILFFLWMDDIWPNLGFRQAEMGMASGDPAVAELLAGNPSLGSAQFNSGHRTGLFQLFDLGAKDIISASFFVPLGFWIGMLMTQRKWTEPKAQPTVSIPPPLPTASSTPPPLPSSQSHDAYKPK